MNLDKKALAGFVTEIEASRERAKAETRHQAEIMKAAKAKQFDTKALRIVLQRRAMEGNKRDEQDYLVDTYEKALAGKKDALEALERGASVREAAKAGGISTGAAGNLLKGVQKGPFVDDASGADDGADPAEEITLAPNPVSVSLAPTVPEEITPPKPAEPPARIIGDDEAMQAMLASGDAFAKLKASRTTGKEERTV